MKRKYTGLVASLLVMAVLGAACGGNDDSTTAASGSDTTETTAAEKSETTGTDTGVSALQAGLTSLLQEHVYLAGIAVVQGVGNGLDSGEFKAAAGTLDTNSKALADAVGGVYGEEAGDQFLELWRKHIGFFVDYTAGQATKDTAKADKAKSDLEQYRTDFGAFLAGANPNLPKDVVAGALLPHTTTVFAAIDSVVANDGMAFENLRIAAGEMPKIATALAGGIAKQKPDMFSGDVSAPAAQLRQGLTHLLQEHVYLAGIAVATGVGSGLDSAGFKAAAGTLDKNSVALSEAVDGLYKGAGPQFLELWRKHIGFFVDYTKGKATKNQAMIDKAKADLDGYRADFGAFLSGANPELTKEAVADSLTPHVKTLFAAIDAAVAKDASVFDKLREAAQYMPTEANILAGAIAKQKNLS